MNGEWVILRYRITIWITARAGAENRQEATGNGTYRLCRGEKRDQTTPAAFGGRTFHTPQRQSLLTKPLSPFAAGSAMGLVREVLWR